MTRPSWLGAPLAASAFVHAALGWRLYAAPLAPPEPLERDTFVVRTVELAPLAPPAAPPPPLLEKPPARPVLEPPPKPAPPKPAPPKPAPPESAPARPEPRERAPEPVTAPEALLGAGAPGTAGVVQVPGAAVGGWVTSTLPSPVSRPAPVAPSPSNAFTQLSDLSRKPRAPALDAALRDNYPPDQRRRGVEGQAEVQVLIEGDGHVGEIRVLTESSAGFAEACRRTLRGSVWSEPLGRDGRPVRTRLTYRCRFRIER